MKQILKAVTHPENVVRFPAGWQGQGAEMVSIPQANGTTMWLTRTEVAAAGYRQITGRTGERVVQFGMCRDSNGAWVYPPPKEPDETLEQVLARNDEARRRMAICRKSKGGGNHIAAFDG